MAARASGCRLRTQVDALQTCGSLVAKLLHGNAQIFEPDGFFQPLHLGETVVHGFAAIAGDEGKRNSEARESIGYRVNGFTTEIDVENRGVHRVFLEDRESLEWRIARTDDTAIELVEKSVHHHGDKRFVFHE